MRKVRQALLAIACAVSALAGAENVTVRSLRLVPGDPTLWGVNGSQRFLVLASYPDGMQRDVTTQSRLAVSDAKLARVEAAGRIVALADGKFELAAHFAGQVAKTTVTAAGARDPRQFSFARELGGIFTKRGCNSSDCHGSVKGKGGLKLSANALYPQEDYRWIVEGGAYQVLSAEPAGPRIPRIEKKDPEKSLLLLKPTEGLPHGGGRRFSQGSADYLAILNWIKSGAPYGAEADSGSVAIARLEAYPRETVLDRQGSQQLLVTAHLSNGRSEDVTDQVLYTSNNPEVVEVTPEGLVKARKTGEAAVMIRAAGQAISAGFGVIAKPAASYPSVPRRNFIDHLVFEKLRRFNIVPSDLAGDEEFLRRVCLDITGTLPPPARLREFLAAKDPNKRDQVIEVLLNSPEYVDYWTFRLADLFRVALFAQPTAKYTQRYWEWIRSSVAQNRPYDQIARERIAGQGHDGASGHYFSVGGEMPRPQDTMPEQVRVFLGRRLDCAQCHNHPYESWSQSQFWGMTAFYGRLTRLGDAGRDIVIYDHPDGHGDLGQGAKVTHPRTKAEVHPAFLDGTALGDSDRADLRRRLAEWMTSHPNFAETAANRLWGYFFGRGIVEPVDDFRLTNPPTHPELLDRLARELRDNGYDLKHLMRLILRSRTYQLSSVPNDANRDDKVNYSHALPRRLDAEVLLDAITDFTGVEEDYGPGASRDGYLPAGTRAINIIWPDNFASQFLEVYGRPNRQMIPQRNLSANLGQALHRIAGETYTRKISKEGGRLDLLLKSGAADRKIIEELYLAGFGRFPGKAELTELEALVARSPSRRQALEDLAWGILTSEEFMHNH